MKCDVVEVPAAAEAQHELEVLHEVLHHAPPALRDISLDAMPQSAWRDIESQSAWRDVVVKGAPQNLCDVSRGALRDAML